MAIENNRSRPRIGVLIDQLRYAGVEKIAINEVLALRKIGFDAKLIVMQRGLTDKKVFKEILRCIPVVFLSDKLPRAFRFSFRFPILSFFSLFHVTFPFLSMAKVSRKDFNVIISHGTYTSFTAIALWKLRGIPFVSYVWDPASYIIESVYSERIRSSSLLILMKSVGMFIDKRIVNNSRLILTACKSHLSLLIAQGGKGKVQLLYPSTDPDRDVNRHKGNYMVVATAWKEGKEPEYLFEIAERDKKLNIVIAGSWHPEEYQRRYLEKLNSLGLQERITVTGALSEEKMREVFSKALFFLQFKADIGFGMPALEAAASGCTFVIPEGQGVCDLFENGVHGFYIKEKDLNSIIAYIELFTHQKDLATKMGVAAWTKVKQKYSWAEHAKDISRICCYLMQ